MIFKASGYNVGNYNIVPGLRCPSCRQMGTFEQFPNCHDVQVGGGTILGQRRCPNPGCHAHVFVAIENNAVRVSYPAQRIDFDSTDIPKAVVDSFEEALTCHAANSFISAAIMVRKTLEELCRDRNAVGATLKDRLTALRASVVLPQALLDAMDALRLLGNDAAHVEAQVYNQVGKTEVEASIALTKEILKAVYQYDSLVKQLTSLQRP